MFSSYRGDLTIGCPCLQDSTPWRFWNNQLLNWLIVTSKKKKKKTSPEQSFLLGLYLHLFWRFFLSTNLPLYLKHLTSHPSFAAPATFKLLHQKYHLCSSQTLESFRTKNCFLFSLFWLLVIGTYSFGGLSKKSSPTRWLNSSAKPTQPFKHQTNVEQHRILFQLIGLPLSWLAFPSLPMP